MLRIARTGDRGSDIFFLNRGIREIRGRSPAPELFTPSLTVVLHTPSPGFGSHKLHEFHESNVADRDLDFLFSIRVIRVIRGRSHAPELFTPSLTVGLLTRSPAFGSHEFHERKEKTKVLICSFASV